MVLNLLAIMTLQIIVSLIIGLMNVALNLLPLAQVRETAMAVLISLKNVIELQVVLITLQVTYALILLHIIIALNIMDFFLLAFQSHNVVFITLAMIPVWVKLLHTIMIAQI